MRSWKAVAASLVILAACSPAQETADWEAEILEANNMLLNEGNLEMIPQFFATTYVAHVTGEDMQGREAISAFVTALRGAFPDLRVEIEVLVTEGNRVAWRRTSRGTHQGDFMGIAGSGRELEWQDVIVTRYENDMIVEEWGESGLASLLHAQ